jgi:hypothetical protein
MDCMRTCVLFFVMFCLASAASAQDWARKMFDHAEHDFGTVARGAKAEHRFTIENIYREDVHIVSVSSSCGCTKPTVTSNLIKSRQKAELVATVDTRSFIGHREAALKVVFDQPFPAEVIVRVTCYIRSDVVVQPGVIDFGSVSQGTAVQRDASVDYAGRPDWRVTAVEVSNPHFEVQMLETSRDQGQVKYHLSVALRADTPAGYIKDQLVLVTNDTNERTARVPVPVEAAVTPGLTVRPSPLMLGVVNTGESVTKHLVAQSQTPFRVTGVRCSDPRFRFEVPSGAKSLHLIPVTFAAGPRAGNVNEVIHIQTDSAGSAFDVNVSVRVVDPHAAALPGTPEWMPSSDKPQGKPADKPKPGVSVPLPVAGSPSSVAKPTLPTPPSSPSLVPVGKPRSSRREL